MIKRYIFNCRDSGFFSVVNEVIAALYCAEFHGFELCIRWTSSSYGEMHENSWENYFEQPFGFYDGQLSEFQWSDHGGLAMWEHIITPRGFVYGDNDNFLLHPGNTWVANLIINKFIKLKPDNDLILHGAKRASKIGVHLRGEGRLDGGASIFMGVAQKKFGSLFDFYKSQLESHISNEEFFICSDSMDLKRQICDYFSNATAFDAALTRQGESHLDFSFVHQVGPRRIGQELLRDVLHLAQCEVVYLGCSNIGNFLRCYAPHILYIDLYDDIQRSIVYAGRSSAKRMAKKIKQKFLNVACLPSDK